MKKLGRALLIAASIYTAYYLGEVRGYIEGALVMTKAFMESEKKKKAQEAVHGQGSYEAN